MTNQRCYFNGSNGLEEVEFIGIFQRSRVIGESPLIGGHHGGTVSGPVAVIKNWIDGKGYLNECELRELTFEKPEEGSKMVKSDGIFTTGDKVKVHKEDKNNGEFMIGIDIVSNIIKQTRGENIYSLLHSDGTFQRHHLEKL